MTIPLVHPLPIPRIELTSAPLVIVGAGPVGVRVTQELHRLLPSVDLVLYGDEPGTPYNRAQLSAYLAGGVAWDTLSYGAALPKTARLNLRLGCEVLAIDRDAHVVHDAVGHEQPYSRLILATGSRPYVPNMPGIDLGGVYTLRDRHDVEALLARQQGDRHIVVVGGGLLGVEAACAMRHQGAAVVLLEQAGHLIARHLDAGAGARVRAHLQTLGVQTRLGTTVRTLRGSDDVAAVELTDGAVIPCDTVILALGIRPRIRLAAEAGLQVARGVRVNDGLETSDPSVYAIGECAEHRGQVYGFLAPGLEQAVVAADRIAGVDTRYGGSVEAARSDAAGLRVHSVGAVHAHSGPCYQDAQCYRCLHLTHGRLAGAAGVGGWPEWARLSERVRREDRLSVWQRWRFRRAGRLWRDQRSAHVTQWPAETIVCHCTGVTRGRLTVALEQGAHDAATLAARTGAATVCGSCRPLLVELTGQGQAAAAPSVPRGLLVLAAVVFAAALAWFFVPTWPHADAMQGLWWRWEAMLREPLYRQISGFILLGITLFALALPLRKRGPWIQYGDMARWRLWHAGIGVVILLALAVHAGTWFGHGLNIWLVTVLLTVLSSGAELAGTIALAGRSAPEVAQANRQRALWVHVLSLWLLPVLLAFHILKGYYY